MTPDIVAAIEAMYEEPLNAAPRVHPASGEDVALCLEKLLALAEPQSTTSENSYTTFLAEKRFGMFFFLSRFMNRHGLTLAFQRSETTDRGTAKKYFDLYRSEFKAHWQEFLAWRASRKLATDDAESE